MRLTVSVTVLVAATACSAGGNSGTAASCVGPALTVQPASARVGDSVQVTGEWFAANCPDTVVNGKTAKWIPLKGLQLDIVQNTRTMTLAKNVDAAGSHQSFAVLVRLAAGLRPGPAVVHVPGYGNPAPLTITG